MPTNWSKTPPSPNFPPSSVRPSKPDKRLPSKPRWTWNSINFTAWVEPTGDKLYEVDPEIDRFCISDPRIANGVQEYCVNNPSNAVHDFRDLGVDRLTANALLLVKVWLPFLWRDLNPTRTKARGIDVTKSVEVRGSMYRCVSNNFQREGYEPWILEIEKICSHTGEDMVTNPGGRRVRMAFCRKS